MTRIDPPLVGVWPKFGPAHFECDCHVCRHPSSVLVLVGDPCPGGNVPGHVHRRMCFERTTRTFRRSKLTEHKPSIVAQYREHRERDSMHLHVLADGTWRIDHTDDFNPDVGPWSAVRHFLADHPIGWIFSGRR